MIDTYTTLHLHTEYSNAALGFTDSINRVPQVLKWCYENGLRGMAVSDHECVSAFVELEQEVSKMKLERPFQHIFSNEIYLISEAENELRHSATERPYYWHYLLTALDEVGLHQLYELSSRAWLRSYVYRGLRRRPTFYSDIEEIIGKDQGHIIGSTACLGGFMAHNVLEGNKRGAADFLRWNRQVFGENNFYLEIQPCYEDNDEQLKVNKALWYIHERTNTPIIVTTDAHYMTENDKVIHKRFLNSKDGGDSRESDKFYATAHLFTPKELRELLYVSGFDDAQVDEMFNNTNIIADRVQPIKLQKVTQIPALPEFPFFPIKHTYKDYYNKYKYFNYYANSNDEHEQFYFAQIEQGLMNYQKTHDIDLDEYIKQIDIEMEQVYGLGQIFGNQKMCDYFTVVQKVVDLIWSDGDSYVGIGRGSDGAYLTNMLLGITGVNPMLPECHDFYPWWRFCSTARSNSLFDCDIDIQSFKKEQIIEAIKNYFGRRRVCQTVTWGRLSSKTAIERACKSLGISNDKSGYLKSLIPIQRGKIYSIKQCVDEVSNFAVEINKYEGLLETALAFEGLILSSGVHAGSVIICKDDFINTGALMVSSNGAVINQFDLHHGEYCGQLKFDLLSIDCLQNLRTCMDLLIENGKIQWQGTLRDTYNKYLSYDAIEKDAPEMWAKLPRMTAAFQYDTRAGKMALEKIGAANLRELTLANGLMRLQSSDKEQPMDKYVRYRSDITEWYRDMTEYGLTDEEQELFKSELLKYNGLCISQETLMVMLMNKDFCNFTMKEADTARKAVAKKNEQALKETEDRLYKKGAECGRSKKFLDYLWNVQIEMSKSYAFAFSHSHEYSTECVQELNLFHFFPEVYWNTAVVTVQSQVEDERENISQSANYAKICQSIYMAKNNGISIGAPNINKSGIGFTPDEATNSILFGLGAISGINTEIAQTIIDNRPYNSFRDFVTKFNYKGSPITTSKFIQLIKGGCFDQFCDDRVKVMQQYAKLTYTPKTSLALNNIAECKRIGVKFDKDIIAPYNYRKYVCSPRFFFCNHPNFKSKKMYWLDDKALAYFNSNLRGVLTEGKDWWVDGETTVICDKSLETLYKPHTVRLKDYINTSDFLTRYNNQSIVGAYKTLVGDNTNPNHWSFEALTYYSQQHELHNLSFGKYNIEHFANLPEEAVFVERSYGERTWREYELASICGTVIGRVDSHNVVTILTVDDEVVNCKMAQDLFAKMKAQISNSNGEVMDKPWLSRGNLLILTGYRFGTSDFRCKRYKRSVYQHEIVKIEKVYDNGNADIVSERWQENDD